MAGLGGLVGSAVGVGVASGSVDAEAVAVCSREVGVISRSVGSAPRVATKATAAIATAITLRITTGEGNTTPRSSRLPGWRNLATSDLEAETTSRPLPLPRGPQSPQSPDEQGVCLEGLGTVDQRVEHLVVAGGGHVELVA